MLEEKLLRQAVESGIITPDQRDELLALVDTSENGSSEQQSKSTAPDHSFARDEAPRFFRSFNDLFIALGVGIFGFALFKSLGLVSTDNQVVLTTMSLIAAGIFWLLAEWLTGIRRINFPSIIILLFFTLFLSQAGQQIWQIFQPFDSTTNWFNTSGNALKTLFISGFIAAGIGTFFWRFRLPFSLLPLAVMMAIAFVACLSLILGSNSLEPMMRWIVLVIGLAIFCAAMWFDKQDPLRTQRTSDQGFWLHLLAAPIITHSVLWNSLQPLMVKSAAPETTANLMALIVLAMFAVFSLIALVIDRRALLISSLGYATAAIGYIIYKSQIEGDAALILTLVLIAGLILSLGTGWYRLRKWIFSLLPPLSYFKYLPPVTR